MWLLSSGGHAEGIPRMEHRQQQDVQVGVLERLAGGDGPGAVWARTEVLRFTLSAAINTLSCLAVVTARSRPDCSVILPVGRTSPTAALRIPHTHCSLSSVGHPSALTLVALVLLLMLPPPLTSISIRLRASSESASSVATCTCAQRGCFRARHAHPGGQ